jgi:site-specific DNA recombinase
MKSAYLYVRVSTDEQKKTGYSLIEQEARLLQYCEINNIKVKGVFREDYSAKDFNRPEWNELIKTIKRNRQRPLENILFLKWDRFSRNIQYAYQMLGLLKLLNVQAMSIDQPIDIDIPESIVMLAMYLSLPEAENSRRSINCSDGMRRARKMGRWPGRAPVGYANKTDSDGRKFIVLKQPEATYVKWSFEQMAKGIYTMSQVRRMACLNGFQCSRNNFWKLLRNPVYCGIVTVRATKTEELKMVKSVHEPLISENLFLDVQRLLNTRQRQKGRKLNHNHVFPLRGFLNCPYCNRRFLGSYSQGKILKYRYYHCTTIRCKGRFRSDKLENAYEEQLQKIRLLPEAYELFSLILEDENIIKAQKEHLSTRKAITSEISKQEGLLNKTRHLFITDKIDEDDFNGLKKNYKEIIDDLNDRLTQITSILVKTNNKNESEWIYNDSSIFQSYKYQDISGKRYIIDLITPESINSNTGNIGPLKINRALLKIVDY